MRTLAASKIESLSDSTIFRNRVENPHYHHQEPREFCADHQFVAMLNAYRCRGGLARALEVVALFNRHGDENVTTLASWIGNRKVLCFDWQSKMWLPLFQFNLLNMKPYPGLGQVLAELSNTQGPFERVLWFAQPNSLLADCIPADKLASDPCAVLHAARSVEYTSHG